MQQQDATFYVSMNGVIIHDEKALLLRKISGGWDLPGGRLGVAESPKQCLVREIQEETGFAVTPGVLLHRWVRRRPANIDVFLVSHLCQISGAVRDATLSLEHDLFGWFSETEVASLKSSKGVHESVKRAFRRTG